MVHPCFFLCIVQRLDVVVIVRYHTDGNKIGIHTDPMSSSCLESQIDTHVSNVTCDGSCKYDPFAQRIAVGILISRFAWVNRPFSCISCRYPRARTNRVLGKDLGVRSQLFSAAILVGTHLPI